ncbi:hypothetical protein [Gandjariella thermophila]|uniref:hypothetical protein n=1 Tax=Gandjariella thermophila TaxID=1931992 RepID=UPI001CEF6935|nr:hypothetical protein [Gandjariella thermophila]
MWIKRAADDVILYQAATTPAHHEQIKAHELGHILSNHPAETSEEEDLQALMPNIPIEVIRRAMRRRTTYHGSAYEWEAETVASILLESAAVARSVNLPSRSTRARHVQRALGDGRNWL